MPKTICTYPGCTATVPALGQPRCAKHPYAVHIDTRESAHQRGYDRKWRKLRLWYLDQYPVCEIQHEGCMQAANEVDHITPLRAGGERLDQDNLQAACRPCHQWKTRHLDPVLITQHRSRQG